jgi:membrane protease YdiL (CAAX protease family)
METPSIDLKTAGLALSAVLLLESAANAAGRHSELSPLVILGTLRVLEIAALLGIASFFENNGIAAAGIHSDQVPAGLKKGILWSLGFGAVVAAAFVILFCLGINPFELMKADMPVKPGDLLAYFLVGAMISPVAEEIFFRGILYGFFRRWGMTAAVVISTLLFVGAHAASSRIPVPQILGGILFAVAYEKEKNLMVPVVIHISGNLAIFIISLVSR